jgi:hypothetical protein
MILFLMIATPILILVIGYLTWSSAIDNYGYNIFNTWVLIRLLIAILLGVFIDPSIGIIMFGVFSIWNFIVTWRNTSVIVAFLAVLFQPAALYFAFAALNRLSKALNN